MSFPMHIDHSTLRDNNLLLRPVDSPNMMPDPGTKIVAEFRERDDSGILRPAAHILLKAFEQELLSADK